jgi:hypothetical protein
MKAIEQQLRVKDAQLGHYQQLRATQGVQQDPRELEQCQRALAEERMQVDFLRKQLCASNSYVRFQEQRYSNLLASNGRSAMMDKSLAPGNTRTGFGFNIPLPAPPNQQLQGSAQARIVGLTGLPRPPPRLPSVPAPNRDGSAIQPSVVPPRNAEERSVPVQRLATLPPNRGGNQLNSM